MDAFIQKLRTFASRTAIISDEKAYLFNDLLVAISMHYQNISEQIHPGGVVLLQYKLSFEGLSLMLALYLNKNIIVPVAEDSEETETRAVVSGAQYRIYNCNNTPLIEKHQYHGKSDLYDVIRNEGHAGLVLFSSGITGTPKGMVHDLDNLMYPFLNKKSRISNFMALLMFDHIGGLNTVFNALYSGAILTIPVNHHPDTICKSIQLYKVNILPASPTMLNLLLISGACSMYDLSSLKIITYGTEPMPEGLLRRLNETFNGVRFLQTFGTSETGISQISSKSSASNRLKFDDPMTEYKIVDGELWIKSHTMIKGYLNASMEQFTDDGWFKSGDLAEIDKEGYYTITGRINEVINVGGLKVSPAEVESAIMEVPSVADCLVYGEKSPVTGNIVAARIQLNDNSKEFNNAAEIRMYLRARLDRYKIPVKIRFVESIGHNVRFKKIRRT